MVNILEFWRHLIGATYQSRRWRCGRSALECGRARGLPQWGRRRPTPGQTPGVGLQPCGGGSRALDVEPKPPGAGAPARSPMTWWAAAVPGSDGVLPHEVLQVQERMAASLYVGEGMGRSWRAVTRSRPQHDLGEDRLLGLPVSRCQPKHRRCRPPLTAMPATALLSTFSPSGKIEELLLDYWP